MSVALLTVAVLVYPDIVRFLRLDDGVNLCCEVNIHHSQRFHLRDQSTEQ